MKLRCEKEPLTEALSAAARAVSARSSALPALAGVRLEVSGQTLHVAGTDLDLTVQTVVEIGDGGDGVCVVPAKLVTDIVRAIPQGAVRLESKTDRLQIEANQAKSHFSVTTMPAEDFPKLPEITTELHKLPADQFAESLRQVVRASSNDDARPILTGVLMATEGTNIRFVATDSYRLALRDLALTGVLEEGQKALIPSRAFGELLRAVGEGESVEMHLSEREATFVTGNTTLTTRLIDGEFPNYKQLLPSSYPNRLTLNKDEFLEAVRRVKLLVKDSLTPVRLAITSSGVTLTVSQESGQATEEVEGKHEGSEITIAFNPEYLIQGIEAIPEDEVVLDTIDPMKPATIQGTTNKDFLYLLMPVRVA